MKTVLFVCFHNSGRSQIAEAMVNQWAQERNLSVRAISAGTVCGKVINPTVIEAMNEIGISLTGQQPKQIMPWHVNNAQKIITMHCGVDPENCPRRFLEVAEDWAIEDPAGKPIETVRAIRDQIEIKVKRLLDDLRSETDD